MTLLSLFNIKQLLFWSKTRTLMQNYLAATGSFWTLEDTLVGFMFKDLIWCGQQESDRGTAIEGVYIIQILLINTSFKNLIATVCLFYVSSIFFLIYTTSLFPKALIFSLAQNGRHA